MAQERPNTGKFTTLLASVQPHLHQKGKGGNVGVMQGKLKPVQGFAGFKANSMLENSLVFGVENYGLGEVVYLVDNPLFRSFWENGKMLFSNAVFMVGQ